MKQYQYNTPCKHCGKITKVGGDICSSCCQKIKLVRQFAVVRDDLRVKLGLPPLAETTSDENTCSIVD